MREPSQRALYKFAVRKPLHKFDLIECTVRGNALFVENDIIKCMRKVRKCLDSKRKLKYCLTHNWNAYGWMVEFDALSHASKQQRATEQSSNIAAESRNSMERVSNRSHQEPARAGLTDSTCLSLDASTVQVAR